VARCGPPSLSTATPTEENPNARDPGEQTLADFVRGRPKQPLDAFMQQANSVFARADLREVDEFNQKTLTFLKKHSK
jgi:hypothetical protein